jgi:hypothetical protein
MVFEVALQQDGLGAFILTFDLDRGMCKTICNILVLQLVKILGCLDLVCFGLLFVLGKVVLVLLDGYWLRMIEPKFEGLSFFGHLLFVVVVINSVRQMAD